MCFCGALRAPPCRGSLEIKTPKLFDFFRRASGDSSNDKPAQLCHVWRAGSATLGVGRSDRERKPYRFEMYVALGPRTSGFDSRAAA